MPTSPGTLSKDNIIAFLGDLIGRVGSDSYLGEAVTMAEHMLQAAFQAEQAGDHAVAITAALLHDIGHYVGEFPENHIELEIDNHHESAGGAVLSPFFPPAVVAAVRWHVAAKRYLCAIEPEYFKGLSSASVKTLALQGGCFNTGEIMAFSRQPQLDTIIRVRRYDDAAKVPGVKTPPLDHYLKIAESVLL